MKKTVEDELLHTLLKPRQKKRNMYLRWKVMPVDLPQGGSVLKETIHNWLRFNPGFPYLRPMVLPRFPWKAPEQTWSL
jgi:hypothetical protein